MTPQVRIHAALRAEDRRGDRRVDQGHRAAQRFHSPHPRIRLRRARSIRSIRARPRSTGCPRTKASPTRPSPSITRTSRSRPRRFRRCSRRRQGPLRFAQVISSGFGEVEEGRELQDELAAARAGGARLIGPNCLGIYTPRGKVTFTEIGPKEVGTVGIVSQSGGLGTDIIRRGLSRGLKFSGLVTVGNCADVTPSDLLEFYFADHADARHRRVHRDRQRRAAPVRHPARRKCVEAGRHPERRPHAAGAGRGGLAHRLARR